MNISKLSHAFPATLSRLTSQWKSILLLCLQLKVGEESEALLDMVNEAVWIKTRQEKLNLERSAKQECKLVQQAARKLGVQRLRNA